MVEDIRLPENEEAADLEKNNKAENIKSSKDNQYRPIFNNYGTYVDGSTISGDFISSNATQNKATNGNININKNVISFKNKEIITTKISRYFIDSLSKVFVAPDKFESFQSKLENRKVIILYGKKDTGRFTASVKAFSGNKKITVVELTEIDFSHMLDFSYEKDSAYIFNNIIPFPTQSLSLDIIMELEATMKEKNAMLIIILDKDVYQALNSHFMDYSFELHHNMENLFLIAQNRIKYYINEDSSITDLKKADSLTNALEVLRDCEDIIKTSTLSKISTVCNTIVREILNGSDIDEISNLINNLCSEAENLFSLAEDIQEKLFMITLAFLEDSSYNFVIKSFRELKVNIYDTLSEENKTQIDKNNYESLPRSKRMDNIGAIIYQKREKKEYTFDLIEHIRFRDSQYRSRIIEYVWKEYDFWRADILEWLYKINLDENWITLNSISYALGVIGKLDFNTVKNCISTYWLKDRSVLYKIITAKTLNRCSEYEGNQIKVLKLIQHWASLYNNQDLNIIALYSYSEGLGIQFAEQAIADISTITGYIEKYGNYNLEYALYSSFMCLLIYNQDREHLYCLILDLFVNSSPKSRYISFILMEMFLKLSFKAFTYIQNNRYLSILLIFMKFEGLRAGIIQMWQRALEDNSLYEMAFDSMRNILEFTDEALHSYNLCENFFILLIRETRPFYKKKIIDMLISISNKEDGGNISANCILKVLKEYLG